MKEKSSSYTLVLYALFAAIIAVLGFTPLGFIVLPVAAITTVHMPVIIGGYNLGVRGGAILGGFFGLMSLIRCFTTPDATSNLILGTDTGFGAYNVLLILLIVFLPRILCGVFSALSYKAVEKHDKTKLAAMGVAAFIGSMSNTVFYLGGLYIFAFEGAANIMGIANPTYLTLLSALLTICAVNGVIEAIAAVIICTVVGKAIYTARTRGRLR